MVLDKVVRMKSEVSFVDHKFLKTSYEYRKHWNSTMMYKFRQFDHMPRRTVTIGCTEKMMETGFQFLRMKKVETNVYSIPRSFSVPLRSWRLFC